jgi:hypothetical protein
MNLNKRVAQLFMKKGINYNWAYLFSKNVNNNDREHDKNINYENSRKVNIVSNVR